MADAILDARLTEYFADFEPIRFEGPESDNPLAFTTYEPDRVVMGKRMEDHLRPAVCFWHTFCWDGFDIFGAGPFGREWQASGNNREGADARRAAAFEFFKTLGTPFYCFHDVDICEDSPTAAELATNFARAVDDLERLQTNTGLKPLWGTANLFSHPRYAAGGLTNPDPEIAVCAMRQVRDCLEATHRLGGSNYVLWGGREGYDTLLNTELKTELDHFGRFLAKIVDHKHRIGFEGKILIEPKPHEPMYHQYDFDTATVHGFLKTYGLEGEVHVNIEPNHATLVGHSFAHEIATACAFGVMGSIDINCGNAQNGWDTDQFNVDVRDITLAMLELLPSGGLDTGGFNFDAKVRRQSSDLADLFHAHISGLDALAAGLLSAVDIIEKGRIAEFKAERYAGWDDEFGRFLLDDDTRLAEACDRAAEEGRDGAHRSGRQEYLEQVVARSLKSV
jgi:xylose isomerase